MNPDNYSISEFGGKISPDNETIKITAPAKINLFLHVLGRRPDGYHNIYSWFQAIDLADILTISRRDDSELILTTTANNIPTDEKNLIIKAALALRQKTGLNSGFDIKLDKNIPVGAGLGGGSSDAAAYIRGINQLLNLNLPRTEMAEIGLEIGSDVPFFFSCGQAEVTGRGEIVRDIELPLNYTILLVNPGFEVSAGEAYRKITIDLTSRHPDLNFRCCKHVEHLFEVLSSAINDLEKGVQKSYPSLGKIRGILEKTGAPIIRLTGSGPTVFALLMNKGRFEEDLIRSKLEKTWGLTITSPVRFSA